MTIMQTAFNLDLDTWAIILAALGIAVILINA
jgi:hypothetical protein